MKAIKIKMTFHLLKEENLNLDLVLKFLIKLQILIKIPQRREILMIGYGVNIQFLRPLLVKELLIEFGAHQKSSLQKNSIFY